MYRMILNETSYFGAGCRKTIAVEAMRRGFKKAFFVTDKDLIRFKVADKIIEVFEKNRIPYELFSDVKANPTIANVQNGVSAFKASGADFIVALGGGSSIDTAKGIGIVVNNPDFADVKSLEGVAATRHKAVPTFALPTTAGTAAEVTINYVIIDEDVKKKMVCVDPNDIPVVAIVDPELMVSIPPHLTAYQGFDAFFHAAEGFIANCATPISDLYALEAIRLIYKYLPVAVADGKNLKARAKIAWASTLAGMVEATSSCTSEHSLEHAMSAYYPQLPHGAGLIALSETYFETFRHDCTKRYMKMAEMMTQKKSNRPSDFIDALITLQKECKVHSIKLSEFGIQSEDFPKFLQNARDTMGGLFTLDPRPITDEEILHIFKKSYK